MRARTINAGLTVNAVAGCHVVILGFDIAEELRPGLRGFAVKRTDHARQETCWMQGTKTFKSVEPHPVQGVQYASLRFPFQTFQWADYTVEPGKDYTYLVVALYGAVTALDQRATTEVDVTTEAIAGTHEIFFNRGAAASQEYARRFQNRPPSKVGPAAYDWLSRGLFEGIVGFIREARDEHFKLRGAFYEFQWRGVLDELRAAVDRNVDVRVVFDDIDNATGPHGNNEDAIAASSLKDVVIPRTNGTLMHNKFLVLIENDLPKAVLFGSTNLTENGLFGHANCAHIVRDPGIAERYLAYFERLAQDPETDAAGAYRHWTVEATPTPPEAFASGMAPVFSPRPTIEALDWYAALAVEATGALFMTFAFGMAPQFRAVYGKDDDILRFGLMEKEWNGRNKDAQIEAVRALQARDNVVIAIGNRIPLNGFDQWLGEIDRIVPDANVHWIHLKFMLVDPLSKQPIVVTGSANFSDASTRRNDENMLVIKDNLRVADIYFGEYMRLYSHYAYREAVKIFLDKHSNAKPEDMTQNFLIEDEDWLAPYFDPSDRSARMARRLYFAGARA